MNYGKMFYLYIDGDYAATVEGCREYDDRYDYKSVPSGIFTVYKDTIIAIVCDKNSISIETNI